jgi:hypothetical protein
MIIRAGAGLGAGQGDFSTEVVANLMDAGKSIFSVLKTII